MRDEDCLRSENRRRGADHGSRFPPRRVSKIDMHRHDEGEQGAPPKPQVVDGFGARVAGGAAVTTVTSATGFRFASVPSIR